MEHPYVSSKGGLGKSVLPSLLLSPEWIASIQRGRQEESATSSVVEPEATGESEKEVRIQPAMPTTLEEIARMREVDEIVPRAVYLNVSTFADRDILTFLSLCTALNSRTINHDSPAAQAIQEWSLGQLIGTDQYTMSIIVEDVIRLVEAQLIQAVQEQ